MKTIIVLLLSIKVAYLSDVNLTYHSSKELIFNGTQYDDIKYPYVVALAIKNKTSGDEMVCTGSLVKKLYVLTAAHCLFGHDAQCVRVFLGSELKKNFQDAAELYLPKAYDGAADISSDVAVIKLKKPFANLKKFIQIGGHPRDFKNNKALQCTCIGFGKITSNSNKLGTSGMMMTTTVTYSPNACVLSSDSDGQKRQWPNWREYLCSKAGQITMTCQGDSGGPMICKNKLYGVCSFGYNYKNEVEFCGGPDSQSVHTFLHFHLKWINNIINPGAKKKKKNSGHSLKPHQLHTILAISLYSLLLF